MFCAWPGKASSIGMALPRGEPLKKRRAAVRSCNVVWSMPPVGNCSRISPGWPSYTAANISQKLKPTSFWLEARQTVDESYSFLWMRAWWNGNAAAQNLAGLENPEEGPLPHQSRSGIQATTHVPLRLQYLISNKVRRERVVFTNKLKTSYVLL